MNSGFALAASTRRRFFRRALLGAATLRTLLPSLAAESSSILQPFARGERRLATYPQKRPLILLTARPPQLETPFHIFNDGILTPNDAFFVRYHLSNHPLEIDPASFHLNIGGHVNQPLALTLDALKRDFEPVDIVAVNQCSGNGRGFSNPRVGGGQSANGAMGNARWRGARLKDVLARANPRSGSRQVVFDGLDQPLLDKTPDYVKSLDIDHALSPDVLLAYSMNGTDLPMLNGYPLRLVVPGFYGTYWIKHLHAITVIDQPYSGYWMSTAYRIPNTPGACIPPGTTPASTLPISRLNIRSFITSVATGDRLPVGRETRLRGIAFDAGNGIREVLFSADHGATWRPATLGNDEGRFSFREWTIPFRPERPGPLSLQCRATSRIGESQPLEPLWNPAGYMRNVVETVDILAS